MKRFFTGLMLVAVSCLGISVAAPQTVSAVKTNCEADFIILSPWYRGLTDGNPPACKMKEVTSDGSTGSIKLSVFVWTIVLNVVDDIFRLVGVLAMGYLIWGGYQYMLGRGDPGKVSNAKKTITNAVVGLIIAVLASSIVNVFMRIILG